jgi:hypothetical protein
MPFEEARAFVRKLNLKNNSDWLEYCDLGNMPDNLPKTPQTVYKENGWIGLGDWLGTGVLQTRKREYLSFTDARIFVRSLHLKKIEDWWTYCKSGLKPHNIPATPEAVYKEQEWSGMFDWLGIDPGNKGKIDYLPYEQAKIIVHKLRIKTTTAWRDCCKRGKIPENIPISPMYTYKHKGWISWRDWLGPR